MPEATSNESLSDLLTTKAEEIAALATRSLFEQQPQLEERFGPRGREKSREDFAHHVRYLAEAVRADSPTLYREYATWVTSLLSNLGLTREHIRWGFSYLKPAIAETVAPEEAKLSHGFLDVAIGVVDNAIIESPSFLHREQAQYDLAAAYLTDVLAGNHRAATQRILDAAESGLGIRSIYLDVLEPVQREIGRLWETNEITVAEEHFATATTQMVMSRLYGYLVPSGRTGRTFLGTCTSGELHELGIRMVTDFIEMAGWDTYYVGGQVPRESVLEMLRKRSVDVLGVSANLTTHLHEVRDLILSVRSEPRLNGVRILVGGRPFSEDPELWKFVGADAVALDAETGVEEANRLVLDDPEGK